MLFSTLVIVAVPVMRKKHPTIERPYKVWFYPVSIVITAAIFAALLVQSAVEDPLNGLVGFGVPAIGAVVYFVFDKINKKKAA